MRSAASSALPEQYNAGRVSATPHDIKVTSMALSETLLAEDLHPIDIVENIAEHYEWDFDRIADDQIVGLR